MGTLALFPAVFPPLSLFKTAPFQLSYPDTRLVPLMVIAVGKSSSNNPFGYCKEL
jgi:hypothetical protein